MWWFQSWSSVVEGGEGSYLPNCQTNLVIALDTLSLLFCIFINTTAYHLGRYEPSSPVSCRAPRSNTFLYGPVANLIKIPRCKFMLKIFFVRIGPHLIKMCLVFWAANYFQFSINQVKQFLRPVTRQAARDQYHKTIFAVIELP